MVAHSDNQAWLDLVHEEALEPDLPICDPHHHLWDQVYSRVQPRYLIDEISADVNGGHNIVSTVFVECGAMFRQDGPVAFSTRRRNRICEWHRGHVGGRPLR